MVSYYGVVPSLPKTAASMSMTLTALLVLTQSRNELWTRSP